LGRSRDSQFRTVIFIDLDGTIMRGPFWTAVFPILFAELARKTGLEASEIRRRVIQENLDRQADPNCPAVRAMDWDDIFDTVASRSGVTLEAQAVEIAHAHASPPHVAVLDGAVEAFRELASPPRAIVVATKGLRKYQLPVLDALGLTPLFNDILTPDVHHALKKDLAFYGAWPQAARLKISVGDHYEDDVVAPRRFGFKTVWKVNAPDDRWQGVEPLDRPARFDYAEGQTIRPDAIIFSLCELPQVVKRFEELG